MSEIIKKEYDVKDFSALFIGGPGKIILNQSDVCSVVIEAPQDVLESLDVIQEGSTLKIRPETMGFFRWIFNRGFDFNGDKITYTISMKNIEKLSFGGSLTIEAGPIDVQNLKISNSGAVKGVFDAINVAENFSVSNSGSVKANFDAVKTNSLNVSASGAVDMVVVDLSAEVLNARASGSMKLTVNSGTVSHQEYHISGSGKVDAVELESKTTKISISGSGKATLWAEETIKVSVSGSGSIFYKGNAEVDQHVSGSGKVKKIHPEMETV